MRYPLGTWSFLRRACNTTNSKLNPTQPLFLDTSSQHIPINHAQIMFHATILTNKDLGQIWGENPIVLRGCVLTLRLRSWFPVAPQSAVVHYSLCYKTQR